MDKNRNNTPYEIIGEMSRDVFGTILRARVPGAVQEITLHALSPAITEAPGVTGMLQDVAQTAKGLDHPNVAQILAFDSSFSNGAVVMGDMPGGSLSHAIVTGINKDTTRSEAIIMQLSSGMSYLHRNQIILHSLTPSNILFDKNGIARLCPVVTGKLLSMAGVDDIPAMRMAVSQSAYCAPELRQGGKGTVRTDIFSLGLIFYDILRGATHEAYGMQFSGLDESALQNIEPHWQEILTKCLAFAPQDRYQDIDELFKAIREHIGQRQVQAFKPTSLFDGETSARPFFRPMSSGQAPGQVVRTSAEFRPNLPSVMPGASHPTPRAEMSPQSRMDASKLTRQETRRDDAPWSNPSTSYAQSERFGSYDRSDLSPSDAYQSHAPQSGTQYFGPDQSPLATKSPGYFNARKAWLEQIKRKRTVLIGALLVLLVILIIIAIVIVKCGGPTKDDQLDEELGQSPVITFSLPAGDILPLETQEAPIEEPENNDTPPNDENEGNTKNPPVDEEQTHTQTDPQTFSPISTMIRPVDGMEMVFVPAGPFIMGSNDVTNEKPEREVYLDAYWIDKYEVSNAQYAKCVEAGGCKARVANNSSKRVSYYGNSDFNDYPVIWVDWNQASAYCEWAGGKLPTEAQWEKAARGLNRNEYPWGNESPICDLANYNQGSNNEPKHCIGDTTAVGSSPGGASYYGVMDMAGNVWEWVRDWYALYNTSEINNPTGPSTGLDSKVIRGGSWGNDSKEIRSAFRHIQNPVEGTAFIGFRCVFPAD